MNVRAHEGARSVPVIIEQATGAPVDGLPMVHLQLDTGVEPR
ncbi:hypothetical protein [Nocardia brevicatena]|nr:hypothetical protein [Nocardia brevicatena]